jgi:hypothetical protein
MCNLECMHSRWVGVLWNPFGLWCWLSQVPAGFPDHASGLDRGESPPPGGAQRWKLSPSQQRHMSTGNISRRCWSHQAIGAPVWAFCCLPLCLSCVCILAIKHCSRRSFKVAVRRVPPPCSVRKSEDHAAGQGQVPGEDTLRSYFCQCASESNLIETTGASG